MTLDSNDQFINWYDHEAPEIHDMERFDLAACSWDEGWKRAKNESELKTFNEWNKAGYIINKGAKGKVVFSKDQVRKKKVRVYMEEEYDNPEDDPFDGLEVF